MSRNKIPTHSSRTNTHNKYAALCLNIYHSMGTKRFALAAVSEVFMFTNSVSCVCSFNKSAIIKLETQSKIIASFTFHNSIKSYMFNTPSTRREAEALDRQSSQENTLKKL